MMPLGWEIAAAGVLGAILGSFMNVVIFRLYQGTTLWGRSSCPHCQTVLRPHHLVPVLSWIFLRGRCASCHRSIHIQYPLVELAMACLTILTYLRYRPILSGGEWSSLFFELFFVGILLLLAVFDLRWKLLPIECMTASIIVFGVWNFVRGGPSIASMLLGAFVGAAFLGIQVLFSRGRWMGAGDPLFALLIGIALGWPLSGYALYFTYIGGGLLMLPLFLLRIVKRGMRIPFGPMLATGALFSLWFGPWLHTYVRQLWFVG